MLDGDSPWVFVLVLTHLQNMALSEMRAQTVVNYLIKRGLDPNQFTAIGKGETEPVASNKTEDGRKANRRVTFSIDQ